MQTTRSTYVRRITKYLFLTLNLCALLFASTNVPAQESQDFVNTWIETFRAIEQGQTGLTLLPILEMGAGGRRHSLGNAYTALANDVSFLESNPAASSILDLTELSIFHRNIYSDVFLDSIAFTQRIENFGYGLSFKFLHFEFSSYDNLGRQIASAIPAEMLLTANASYSFFSNYEFSGIALGLNLKLALRAVPHEIYQRILDPISSPQDIVAVLADIGLITRFNFLKAYPAREENFSLGLSFINISVPIKGYSLPTELRAGISYKPFAFITLASDIFFVFDTVDFAKSEGLGFSLGTNLQFIRELGIQAGFEMRGANPRLSMGTEITVSPIRFNLNYNLDLTTSTNSLSNFSIAMAINFGDEGRSERENEVNAIYIEALRALSVGDYQRAIELCDLIINLENGLDITFTPARETKDIAILGLEQEAAFSQFEQEISSELPETES